jgi:hypothetical protein
MSTDSFGLQARMSSSSPNNEYGVALVVALLIALLVGAIAAVLVALTTTETLVSASFRHAREASYGAEAAVERGLHDLAAMPDWSPALSAPPANVTSTFVDGVLTTQGPDGRPLDLVQLTSARQAESDARDGPAVFGGDSPQWRLFAHAPIRALPAGPPVDLPLYLAVWVADDESDGDGDPTVDTNGQILVWGGAYGAGRARRSVEARIGRSASGELRVLAWREAQ